VAQPGLKLGGRSRSQVPDALGWATRSTRCPAASRRGSVTTWRRPAQCPPQLRVELVGAIARDPESNSKLKLVRSEAR
jgi:hypothetical protein